MVQIAEQVWEAGDEQSGQRQAFKFKMPVKFYQQLPFIECLNTKHFTFGEPSLWGCEQFTHFTDDNTEVY